MPATVIVRASAAPLRSHLRVLHAASHGIYGSPKIYRDLSEQGEMPPAKAFWSLTLYDSANGFFIPNDRKKYIVGENGGMKLIADGGIDVYVAAETPERVPDENWLPINRKDENLDVILRIYMPDLE